MINPAAWSMYRGKQDGERWAQSHASLLDLMAWSDISDFEYYMGDMPFPFDNEVAVKLYEQAKADAVPMEEPFSHRFYAMGFLEAVYETFQAKFAPPEDV